MNYRKFYEQELETSLSEDMEVHHLDLNKNNNEINNLIAIPRRLHKCYHLKFNEIKEFFGDKNIVDLLFIPNNLEEDFTFEMPNLIKLLKKFYPLYFEILKYVKKRDLQLMIKYMDLKNRQKSLII